MGQVETRRPVLGDRSRQGNQNRATDTGRPRGSPLHLSNASQRIFRGNVYEEGFLGGYYWAKA
ncbi:MAG TPA: hypothetical protein VF844_22910 [Ktedonobacteraceae bacterium]